MDLDVDHSRESVAKRGSNPAAKNDLISLPFPVHELYLFMF